MHLSLTFNTVLPLFQPQSTAVVLELPLSLSVDFQKLSRIISRQEGFCRRDKKYGAVEIVHQ